MKKKLLSILLVMVLLLACVPMGVSAANTGVVNGMTYEIVDGEVTITGYIADLPAELVIPSVIEGYPVTTIGDSAFSSCDSLTSVIIPDSVIIIENLAFLQCRLTSITIPNSVTIIGDSAFGGNPLTFAIIGNGVTVIGQQAFMKCGLLETIVIPDNVALIGSSAFAACGSLTSVIISNGVTTIEESTFSGCEALVSVSIPHSVTSIGALAFSGCFSLTTVTIPDSVTTIGECAFADCDSLTSVIIPDSVTAIGEWAFGHCYSLTSVTIPDSVTTIEAWTFVHCVSLISVAIPDSVTTIGDDAFYHCASLTSITIPKSVTSIGSQAFGNLTLLTEVYYTGTEEDRANIVIFEENDSLLNATWHYTCINPSDHYAPDVDNSVMDTEQGNGLAYKFELKVNGLKAVKGNHVDFSDATVNYKGKICKVVAMGSVLSNVENKNMELKDVDGRTIIDVPVVYLTELEEDSCAFAVRIINIPEHALDRTIYARPYYVIETDKGNVTVYGKISSASCAEYM